jgi:hypothetical protein
MWGGGIGFYIRMLEARDARITSDLISFIIQNKTFISCAAQQTHR